MKAVASLVLATVCLFAVAQRAFSDPVAVNWAGTPVIVSADGGSPYGTADPTVNAEQNGIDADLFIAFDGVSGGEYWPGPDSEPPTSSMDSIVDTPFTITSPADIMLALTVAMSDGMSSCGDGDCDPNLAAWPLFGAFTGSLAILGANGTDELSVYFGDSGLVAAVCVVGIGCTASLDLSDTEPGSVQLAAGTYTLEERFVEWNDSIGDGESTGQLSAVISTVPEPAHIWLMIAAFGLVIARSVWLQRLRSSSRERD
jgi:hypothetical protein